MWQFSSVYRIRKHQCDLRCDLGQHFKTNLPFARRGLFNTKIYLGRRIAILEQILSPQMELRSNTG